MKILDNLNVTNNKISNLALPALDLDAVNLYWVLNYQAYKRQAKATSTGNITLSGQQTIDGVSLVAGDRCLVTGQSSPANNGIYVVSTGVWTRSIDADTWAKIYGSFIWIDLGIQNGDRGFFCTVSDGGTIGTTPITYIRFSRN